LRMLAKNRSFTVVAGGAPRDRGVRGHRWRWRECVRTGAFARGTPKRRGRAA
jgi:hypothetical protein